MKNDVVSIDCLRIKLKFGNDTFIETKTDDCINDLFDCGYELKEDKTTFKHFTFNPIDVFNLNDFELKIDDKHFRNKFYKYVYSVYYKGELLGYISWFLYNRVYDESNLKSLDIENNIFYKYPLSEYISIIELLISEFGLVFNNFECLDICIDNNFNIIKRFKFYHSKKDKYYFKSCNEINKKMDDTRSMERDLVVGEGLRISGSYDSLKFYNKSLEIKNSSKKYYILNYFNSKGLDMSKDIYRREIHITGRSFFDKKIKCDLSYISTKNNLIDLFNNYWIRYIDFRIIDKKKNVKEYKKIDLLKL